MKALLLLPFLLAPLASAQDGGASAGGAPLVVLDSGWSKIARKAPAREEPQAPLPAAALTRADLNFERNRRASDPPGMRYPEADSVDARAAELEKTARAAQSPKRKTVEGFEYRARVRNAESRAVEVVFWEYEFTERAAPSNVVRRQFLCGVQIKPGKEKELQAFIGAGPSSVVDAASLANKPGDVFAGKATINRVEYADGTIWQRRGWRLAEVREAVARATSTPWGQETCRGL